MQNNSHPRSWHPVPKALYLLLQQLLTCQHPCLHLFPQQAPPLLRILTSSPTITIFGPLISRTSTSLSSKFILTFFVESLFIILQPRLSAIPSTDSFPMTSVAVVITGIKPITASFFASLFPPW